jgi:hypothetical protein
MPAHYDKLSRLSGSPNQSDWIAWLKDPYNNIKAAAEVYNSQGLEAWTIFYTGAYSQYLDNFDGYPTGGSTAGDGSHLTNREPTLWESLKTKALDTWYYLKGTDRERANYPSAEEQLAARQYYNENQGTDLPTDALEREIAYKEAQGGADLKAIGKSVMLAVIVLIVFIIGSISFFKALDVSAPPLPGKN